MELNAGIRLALEELIEQFKPPCQYTHTRSAQSSSLVVVVRKRKTRDVLEEIDQLKAGRNENGEYILGGQYKNLHCRLYNIIISR